ncbi:hypothetical protein [Chloroflexus sp.]|uniref:hypothetical protein n=1 Tax=Chloroflexus sp. TaxID=1904827 RepID=UPI002ADD78CD|nr:hypothetical protein [Chloroflexus sp.]
MTTDVVVAGLVALLLYPGILFAIGLSIGYRILSGRPLPFPGKMIVSPDLTGGLGVTSLALIGGGLAGLTWPGHPWSLPFGWISSWALFELAAWLPLLPALMAGAPRTVRAALREAQIGMLARAILWGSIATGLAAADNLNGWSLSGHGCILLSALLSLPAAINWGPFGPEPSLGPQGITEGLSTRSATTLTFTRDTLAAALIAAIWLASLPIAVLPVWLGLLVIGIGSIITTLGLRWLNGRFPRFSVPAALRVTLIGAGSLAGLALVAISVGQM